MVEIVIFHKDVNIPPLEFSAMEAKWLKDVTCNLNLVVVF